MQLYQIYFGSSDNDTAERELSREKKGVKERVEPSHSPFGFIYQIAKDTGWTVDYILDKVSYPTLLLMIADAPRYRRKADGEAIRVTSKEQLFSIFGERT